MIEALGVRLKCRLGLDRSAFELPAGGLFREIQVLLNAHVDQVSGPSRSLVGSNNLRLFLGLLLVPTPFRHTGPKTVPLLSEAPPWLVDSRGVPVFRYDSGSAPSVRRGACARAAVLEGRRPPSSPGCARLSAAARPLSCCDRSQRDRAEPRTNMRFGRHPPWPRLITCARLAGGGPLGWSGWFSLVCTTRLRWQPRLARALSWRRRGWGGDETAKQTETASMHPF